MTVPTYGLAIHTSSPDLGLALRSSEGEGRSHAWPLGREVSNYLHAYLQEFLLPQTWQDLAFLAVAVGPGGFTGTRLGVVTARTLAQQLEIPVFGISSLAAVAWQARSLHQDTEPSNAAPLPDIAVQMRAQREEVFTAIYRVQSSSIPTTDSKAIALATRTPTHTLETIQPDTVMTGEQWQRVLDTWPQPYQLVVAEGDLGHTATQVLELAYGRWVMGDRSHWSTVLPFYGQHCV